jgi:glycosyltransferase involved in cell wall biosynthesis
MPSSATGEKSQDMTPSGEPRIAVLLDQFPELSETFIVSELRAMRRLGAAPRVEAVGRARRPVSDIAGEFAVSYLEDDARIERMRDLAWLVARSPLACARDLAARRRWCRQEQPMPLRALAPIARRLAAAGEQHLHAHFAGGSALNALRLSRLLDVSWSFTAHGYDIYIAPGNLREKLEAADFSTSGSEYTVAHLRGLCSTPAAERVHRIGMGIDGDTWRRDGAGTEAGLVVAVGRLVPKKGFDVLLDATARLRDEPALEHVVIVGDGPLREDLVARRAALGLDDRVDLVGALEPDAVRATMQRAAVLAVPCVVAESGDRDSMPLVAKEALALEVPVVASDEVGLPEVVRDGWGRLVAPGDPAALADALGDVLRLPADQREAMGAAGRQFVLEHFDARRETARLLDLIRAVVRP